MYTTLTSSSSSIETIEDVDSRIPCDETKDERIKTENEIVLINFDLDNSEPAIDTTSTKNKTMESNEEVESNKIRTWRENYVPFNNEPISSSIPSSTSMMELSSFKANSPTSSHALSESTSIETVETNVSSGMSHVQSINWMKQKISSTNWQSLDSSKDYLCGKKAGNSFFHTSFEDDTSTHSTKAESIEAVPESIPKNFRKLIPVETSSYSGSLDDLETISSTSTLSTRSIMSRQEEKSALQVLNNRLAAFMDNVRVLKNETNELRLQLKICEENKSQNVASIKALYTDRIGELERAIESMNRHCNKLKLGTEGLIKENKSLERKLDGKEMELSKATEKTLKLVDENRKLYDGLMRERDENDKARVELEKLLPHHEKIKTNLRKKVIELEQERLKASDLSTKAEHMEKDYELKRAVLEKELLVLKQQNNDQKQRLKETYDNQLEKELQELRLSSENNSEKYKLDKLYLEEKLENLQSEIANERAERTQLLKDNEDLEDANQDLAKKISILEEELKSKMKRISLIKRQRDDEIKGYQGVVKTKEDQIKHLKESLCSQKHDNDELQQANIDLGMEIATFQNLLDDEEGKL